MKNERTQIRQNMTELMVSHIAEVKKKLKKIYRPKTRQTNLIDLWLRFPQPVFLSQREDQLRMEELRIKAAAFDRIMELVG